MIKAIIFDLDDTLLRSDKTVSLYSLDIFRKLQEKGYLLVINTARSFFNTLKYIDIIKPDYCILDGGSLVIDSNHFPIYENLMSKAQVNKILPFLKEQCPFFAIETSEGQFALTKRVAKPNLFYLDVDKPFNYDSYKIIINFKDGKKIYDYCLKNNLFFVSYYGGKWGRINNKNVSKLNGIIKMCEKIHISTEECICFGDDYGDYDMLKYCGYGVCPLNAQQKLLDDIKEHCDTNDNDGVAKYLEEKLL